MPSWDSLWCVDWGRKVSGLVCRWFCAICMHRLKVDRFGTGVPLWDSPGRWWWMEILLLDRTGSSAPVYFACKEMARRKGLPWVMVWLGRWTGRSTTGKSRGLRIELSDWQRVKMFGFHVNAHWRAGEGFNNRVDGMTHLVDIRQPPSPATPVDLWT